ncbi:hypothetical protein KAI04_04105 [Candidatus Pacearchaeota archaeon]|nr:hypothetical protein [Candidatus Pacearchaeota archaeon]
MEKQKENKIGNVCGIVGLCTSWFIPFSGIVLGIIALARKEKYMALGILSILVGIGFTLSWLITMVTIWSIL